MADDLDTFDPVRGPARERIDAEELADPRDRASVILDRRRRKPRYFDGRFLAARDLTRGQQYRLLRQADLAQLAGSGVAQGLEVTSDGGGVRVAITAGSGVARSGESVVLRTGIEMAVVDVPVVSGRATPTQLQAVGSDRVETGIFMLIARPVEHTRSPGPSFAGSTLAEVEIEDDEIVEGTWLSWTPVADGDAQRVLGRGRAQLAREIFTGGFDPAALSDGLVLAVAGLVRGRIEWIDPAMAMRDVGSAEVLGLGLASESLRIAYARQYRRHLDDVVQSRRRLGLPEGMLASEAFSALPPVGPLPRGALEVTSTAVRQQFFPREVYVEIAIMPEDELPAMLEEGMRRAPIDLEVDAQALERVPILIVVPVPRAGFDRQTQRMEGAFRGPILASTGRPLVTARPIDGLAVLRRKYERLAPADPLPLDLEAWRRALESAGELWYLRRGQFASTSSVVPRRPAIDNDVAPIALLDEGPRELISGSLETLRFNQLFAGADRGDLERVGELLSAPLFRDGQEAAPGSRATESRASEAVAARVNPYVSGMMGELSYMARRAQTDACQSGTDIPRSPVFVDLPMANHFRLRPLETSDLRRVQRRFLSPGVSSKLKLSDAEQVATLSAAAVVPELAYWVTTDIGRKAGGAKRVAELAAAADVAGLRALVEKLRLPGKSDELPDDKDDSDSKDPSSKAFANLRKLALGDDYRAVWHAAHPDFRVRLDAMFVEIRHAQTPVFAASFLMDLITVGHSLAVETDEQAQKLLAAIVAVNDGEREFVANNGDAGKVLALADSPRRDAVVERAAKLSARAVSTAQKRLVDARLISESDKPAARKKSVAALRLLALSAPGLTHIEAIAQAREVNFSAFEPAALRALEQESLTSMQSALRLLSGRPNLKFRAKRGRKRK